MAYKLVSAKNAIRAPLFKLFNRDKPSFECPLCHYVGPFVDKIPKRTKYRAAYNAKCPRCSSMERHRFQYYLLEQALATRDTAKMAILHFAPEPSLEGLLRERFGSYASADLLRGNVDHQFDVQAIPLADASFDVVLITHVLQYVEDETLALGEIRRILKPGGLAVIPVPMVRMATQDLAQPKPPLYQYHEAGPDFYARYTPFFDRVALHNTRDYDDKYHFYREHDPDNALPLEIERGRYGDIIPLCYVDGPASSEA